MKILVVDDEKDVQSLFEQRFRREIRSGEWQFTFANSGSEALEVLNILGTGIANVPVVSDINMPGMTGLELLQKIKTTFTNPSPMVFMMSAYGDEENYGQAMKYGADGFFTKPVDFMQLKEKLRAISN